MPKAGDIKTARAIMMYIIVSLFLFFEMAVQVSPSVMAFDLMHDLGISALGLGILSGCYFYTYTAMQLPSGLLFDRLNPRYVICTSLLVCSLGAVLLGFAHGFVFACLSRLLMGLGSAFAFVSVLVVTKDLFSHKAFALMTGITQMLAAFGAMSGQLPISSLVHAIGWRHTMLCFALVGFVLTLAVFYWLRYDKAGNCESVKSGCGICRDLASIVKQKQTWLVALYALLLWSPMAGFTSLWGVPFLIKVDHFSNQSAAFLASLMWLGLAFASPFLGWISTRLNSRKGPLAISALIGGASFGLILFVPLGAWALGILLFLSGAACSGQALSFTVVKENNSAKTAATAIAFNNMAVVISGALFQPLIGWVISSGANSTQNYVYGLSMIFGAYLTAFLIAACLILDPLKRFGSMKKVSQVTLEAF